MIRSKCVVIGGGTGSFTVLSSLKNHVSDMTAVVNMADDGGSTGTLRDELGVLPVGDIRQCLVALSNAPQPLRDLFNFRFVDGALTGHSFGNLFLGAMQSMTHSFADAVSMASAVLDIQGHVVPITLDDVRLVIEWADGTVVKGEGRIDIMHFVKQKGLPNLRLEPAARLNPAASQAIADADIIIIAPGDLYTSLGPLLSVDGVADALAASSAKKLYICNLVIKPGQTSGFTVADHAAEIERLAGGPILDYVLYNTARPSQNLTAKYQQSGEVLVEIDDQRLATAHYRAIGTPLISSKPATVMKGDALAGHRTYIRHDSLALLQALTSIITQ